MIREWLPITRRNRIALGFAFAALVMFLVWNCTPFYPYGRNEPDGLAATKLWPQVLNVRIYIRVMRSPDIMGFVGVAAMMAMILNALVVLAVVPFWKIFHASAYLTAPIAVVNFLGGFVFCWAISEIGFNDAPAFAIFILGMMTCSMFALAAAMCIFKNELQLRHEREVGETLNSKS